MATAVIMPKQGQSVETCIITKWFKNKGESVSIGDILFSYETDKAAFDLESPAEGILLDIFYSEGAEVPVLVNVAVIGKEGESADSFKQNEAAVTHESEDMGRIGVEGVEGVEDRYNPENSTGRKIRISPRAKRLAIDKRTKLQ